MSINAPSTGVKLTLTQKASLDFSGGYVFDRYFFEGKNITSGTNVDRVDVGARALRIGSVASPVVAKQ